MGGEPVLFLSRTQGLTGCRGAWVGRNSPLAAILAEREVIFMPI